MDTPKVRRRTARRRALQCIFALSFQKVESMDQVRQTFRALPEDDEDEAAETGSLPRSGAAMLDESSPEAKFQEDMKYALRLVLGVHARLSEIDDVIRRFSKHWRIDRIAKAELSILRLSVYELLHEPDIPMRVSINEAVELSKEFADDNSFPFVNGILDAVARAVSHGEFGIPQQI